MPLKDHSPPSRRAEARPPHASGPQARPSRSPLLRLMAINGAIGVGLGWGLLALLIWTDTMGLATLIAHAANPWAPILMLAVVFAVTIGAAVMGTAVLSLPVENKRDTSVQHDPEQDRPR